MNDLLPRVAKTLPIASMLAAFAGFTIINTVDGVDFGWSLSGAVALGSPPMLLYVLTRVTLATAEPMSRALGAVLALITVAILVGVLAILRYLFSEDPEMVVVLCIVGVVAFALSALLQAHPRVVVATGWLVALLLCAMLFLATTGSSECWNCGEFSQAGLWTLTALAAGGLASVALAFMCLPGIARILRRDAP